MDKKIIDVLEKQDFNVNETENEIELEWYSPEGEDFVIYVSNDDFVNDFIIQTNIFDPDEHAEMWINMRGKNGVPNSIRALLNDADAIKKHLLETCNLLREVSKCG